MGDFTYLTLKDILTYYRETIDQSGGGMFGIREQDGIEKILDFVQKLPLFAELTVNGQHYFLSHSVRIS